MTFKIDFEKRAPVPSNEKENLLMVDGIEIYEETGSAAFLTSQ